MRLLPLFVAACVGLEILTGMDAIAAKSSESDQNLVFIGTYTGVRSKGIYVARFDPKSGELSPPQLAAETKNPTFLALSPDRRFLYAANEVGDFKGQRSGAVSAFAIDRTTGQLAFLNEQPSAGSGPCHLAVDRTGKCVLVANYGSGSIGAFQIEADGRLGPPSCQIQHHGSSVNPSRQEGPHAHFITTDPDNRFALTCDLGLDEVLIYHLNPQTGMLSPKDPPFVRIAPGAGPRHLAFHPNGRWAYVINELNSTITACDWHSKTGMLKTKDAVSTLPPGFSGRNTCAEIAVHPSGKWVFGSNRGDDSIAVFAVEASTGELRFSGVTSTRGKTPRHFALDPSGKWLLAENQDSNDLFVFRFDARSGVLEPTGDRIEVGAPVCLLFAQ